MTKSMAGPKDKLLIGPVLVAADLTPASDEALRQHRIRGFCAEQRQWRLA